MRRLGLFILMALVTAQILAPAVLTAAERSEVPDQYKWNLADLYASEADWIQARDALRARIPEVAAYQGKLGESAATFYKALDLFMTLSNQADRVGSYASQLSHQDMRESHQQEMVQSAQQLGVDLGVATSWVTPEIIAMGAAKVDKFTAAEPKLAPFKPYLDNLLRSAPHTRGPVEEEIIAQAGNIGYAAGSIYSIFTNADMPYPDVTLSNGETVRMDAAAYTQYRASTNPEDRKAVFQAFWSRYQEYRRTLGTALYQQIKSHMFTRDVRNYDSCLEAALFWNNIPTDVYRQLIADAHDGLPTLHRYLKLRQRMLGLDHLGYEDLYAPLVSDVDLQFTPEEAMDLTLDSFKPLGPEYTGVLGKGYRNGWVDFLPSTGKRSGAYSTMVYGVHPYELLNFMGAYDDVSTLAHESGHSMHSYLSAANQPYVTHDYSIFVAEVASTLNEDLLFRYMLNRTTDDDTRLSLLGSYLENLRTTLFRQTQLAEFELAIHETAERGESLSGDSMNEIYLGILKKYYGHDEGVCQIDDLYAVEWAYIPHFYYNFYVYQYATSLVASTSIAKRIREEEAQGSTATRDAYIAMLSSGSSKYPVDQLKEVGVDMTTSEPFKEAMQAMNQVMDEIEAILESKGE